MLTPRQEFILLKVVDSYLQAGQPIGSKVLAADPALDCGPSTIRNELAMLEEHGLLAHPHTSAGRVPTDAGHRYVVDRLLASTSTAVVPAPPMELGLIRRELDEAMRVTTETLSEVCNLLAIVTAPAVDNATIRHIEVLTLQPSVVLVVVITSAGGVSKYVCNFEQAVDPGLVAWSAEYLAERLNGLTPGARMIQGRLADPTLGPRERAFVERLAPAFSEQRVAGAEDNLYVEGASRLLGAQSFSEVHEINALMELLERRVELLSLLRGAFGQPGVFVRIGAENEVPAMRSLSLVAAGYGLSQRTFGAVSVIGPVRMDYGSAITTVRAAARELSRFVEDVYDAG
ncbi:MAG: heat-inducible transcriptional repressor HrcA [Solirubrobacteraceae bacterium]